MLPYLEAAAAVNGGKGDQVSDLDLAGILVTALQDEMGLEARYRAATKRIFVVHDAAESANGKLTPSSVFCWRFHAIAYASPSPDWRGHTRLSRCRASLPRRKHWPARRLVRRELHHPDWRGNVIVDCLEAPRRK